MITGTSGDAGSLVPACPLRDVGRDPDRVDLLILVAQRNFTVR
jgi:hypothetical protein